MISNGLDCTAHTLTAAIFGCHGIPVEAVSTPLAVAAIRIPDAFQAFSGDRITAPGLQGVNVAIAVTREAGIPRHCWVSIVTVCASARRLKRQMQTKAIPVDMTPLSRNSEWFINQTESLPKINCEKIWLQVQAATDSSLIVQNGECSRKEPGIPEGRARVPGNSTHVPPLGDVTLLWAPAGLGTETYMWGRHPRLSGTRRHYYIKHPLTFRITPSNRRFQGVNRSAVSYCD